jgi:hypothetical protein
MMFLFNILLQTANAVDPAGAAAAQPTGAPAATEHVSAPILEIITLTKVIQ